MKNLKLLSFSLLFFILGFQIVSSAQTGTSCIDAIPVPISTLVTDTTAGTSKWYSFTSIDTTIIIVLKNLSDESQGHIHAMNFYGGTCSSLQLINTAYARNDMATDTFGISDSLFIIFDSIIPGQTYYLNLDRQAPIGQNCRICQNSNNGVLSYSLRIDPLPTPQANVINFTYNPSTCYYPGCVTFYNGHLVVSHNDTYRIVATQSGPFNFFSNTTYWVTITDNNTNNSQIAVDASGVSQNLTLSNSTTYTVYLNARISCTAIGGLTDILSFTVQRRQFFTWNTVASTQYPITICHSALVANSTICLGGSTTLTAVQPTGPYTWSLPVGLSCTTCQSPVATPTVTTSYTLTVNNPNSCCPVINDVVTVTVDQVHPSFTTTNEICVGSAFTFTNTSTNCTNYLWNFGDGSVGTTATNPTHIYSSPGQYVVTLTGNDANCTAQIQQLVSVTPSTSSYNPGCCSNNEVYIHNASVKLQSANDINNFLASFVGNIVSVRDTIFIQQNQTLSLTGKTIYFGPWGKIIIEEGSQLILDACFLDEIGFSHDPQCSMMWQGIEVWGNNFQNQIVVNPNTNSLYQGKLVIRNTTSIRNAHNGVMLGKWKRSTNSFDLNSGGGILLASTGSVFLNCGYGIRFNAYKYINNSRITGCNFTGGFVLDPGYNSTNSYTYPNTYNRQYAYANTAQRTYAFAVSVGDKFVLFDDNIFNNAEYGVIGVNSALRLLDINNSGFSNTFTNLKAGDVHTNFFSSPFNGNQVKFNTYTATLIPIQTWGGLAENVSNNFIPQGAFVGIGNVSSQAIAINDNTIGGSTNGCLIGISTSNTGTMGGIIGRNNTTTGNQFTKCLNGTWMGGNNSFLQVNCNTYVNPTAANYNTNWGNSGLLADQGSLPIITDQDPAGNTFIQSSPLRNQINSSTLFDYYAHSADVSGNPVTVLPTPTGSLTASNIINTGIQQTNTSCDPGPPCTNCGNLIALINFQVNQLENEKAVIENQLDGGQTQQLLDAINSNMSSGELENLLLSNSPLSDLVLLTFIARSGTPPGIFKNVIVANSPVSKDVRPTLYAAMVSMPPPGIQNEVVAAQSNYSNRTLSVVDGELQSAIAKRQQLFNQQMDYFLANIESDSTMKDSVYVLLSKENTEAANEAIAASYISDGNYIAATQAIENLNPKTIEEIAERDLLILLNSIYSKGRDIYTMAPSEEQQVRIIAALQNDCVARANAKVILFAAFGEPLELEFDLNTQRIAAQDTISLSNNEPFLGECYPNPATNGVNMECNIPGNSTGILRIFDMNGKLVFTQQVASGRQVMKINTSGWQAGIYMCWLDAGEIYIGIQKLVIMHQE